MVHRLEQVSIHFFCTLDMATSDAWNVSACGETILPGLTWEEMEPSQAKNGKDREWTRPRDIPLDIARLIFEKAMEDTPAPVHLALVSRQVQHWCVILSILPVHDESTDTNL